MIEWIAMSSVLILVVIALRVFLRKNLSATVCYALWAVVLLRLLIPFSLYESTISFANSLQTLGNQTADAVAQYEDTYDRVVQQHVQTGIAATPSQIREEVLQQVHEHSYESISDRYHQQGILVPEQQLQQEAQTYTQTIDVLALAADILPIIWYTGMVLVAVVFLVSNAWFSWNLHKTRTPVFDSSFPLPVFETGYTATPCLFGLIFPKVYLTPETADDPMIRNHVLAHELTHYRHGDHIWSMLRGICLVLHWYNPLVWVAAFLSKKDAELACDEATVRVLGEAERVAYGKTLIDMTCIRHDLKAFLVTATTMVGSKNVLKERITAISRKPRNAAAAMIACVLVLAIAGGCAFAGPANDPSDPTEPTTADDAVYEKVQAAAQAINTLESYYFKYWITLEHPAGHDFSAGENYTQGWISGEDVYVEQAYLGPVTPSFIRYNGELFNHAVGNIWLSVTESVVDKDYYRITIPSLRDHTMTWNETDQYMDVAFVSNDDPNRGFLFRLDSDGSLLWYAPHMLVPTTNVETGETTNEITYSVMVYPSMDPDSIRKHLDTVVPPLIAGMEIYDYHNGTPLTTESFVFIYQDDFYWEEYIGPNDCKDGYLYVQDRTTMEFVQVLDVPVELVCDDEDQIFCVTSDHKVMQVDYTGANQRMLYQASGEVSDISCFGSKLYFNDGTELIALDLDTLVPAEIGNFPDYREIHAVTENWLWLNVQGTDYAFDTVTFELEPIYTLGTLEDFLNGIWPDAYDFGVDLPENYTLNDIVSSIEETLTWSERGTTHETTFSIPNIYPFSTDAVRVQEEIDAEWTFWLEEQRNCSDLGTGPVWEYVRYDAALNGDLLSIVIDVLWTNSGTHSYRVYNLDLSTGASIRTTEMVNRYLNISYPEFLMAVSEYRMDELQATQPGSDIRALLSEYAPDVTEMDQAELYFDKDGNLCLMYHALDISGAIFYPTVTPFSLNQVDWEVPTEQEAYLWLFNLYKPEEWAFSDSLSDYWALIQKTYAANISRFGRYTKDIDDKLAEQLWYLVSRDDPTKTS